MINKVLYSIYLSVQLIMIGISMVYILGVYQLMALMRDPLELSIGNVYYELNDNYTRLESDNNIIAFEKGYRKYSISLPLAKENYYKGKFDNVSVAISQFNQNIDRIDSGERVDLLKNDVLYFDSREGYIIAAGVLGSGTCWFVTGLGGLIDITNSLWINEFNHSIVYINRAYPHRHWFKTYSSVNRGYGYSVLDDPVMPADFAFTLIEGTNAKTLNFGFYAISDFATGYKGYSVDGYVYVTFK